MSEALGATVVETHSAVVFFFGDRAYGLSVARLEAARVRLVLVGGCPGTGKSTLALGAGAATGAVVLRCTAPAALASERLLARSAAGGGPSDASPAVAAAMAAAEDPWPTATAIDTARDPASSLADVLKHITRRVAPVAA